MPDLFGNTTLYERIEASTHSYIGIYDGICKAMFVDTVDDGTADFCSEVIRNGGYIVRVLHEVARDAFQKPWPPKPEAKVMTAPSYRVEPDPARAWPNEAWRIVDPDGIEMAARYSDKTWAEDIACILNELFKK